jgi:hypothetical protein
MAQDRNRSAPKPDKLSQWSSILSGIPAETRIFAIVFLVIEAVLAGIIPFADNETKKYIALGMVATAILCVFFVGLALLRTKPNSITLLAPPAEEREGKVTRFKFDAFVAAPIDALMTEAERATQRSEILSVVDCLKKKCKFQNIYYAGEQAKDPASYDQPSEGLLQNVQRIRASTYFILIYPQLLPTSALVEVGMALALGKRSVWFIQKEAKLPYLLREGGAVGGRADLPRINVRNYAELKDILTIIDKDPEQIFNFE